MRSVTVAMSSWGCQAGSSVSANCVTTPGATFNHPITLNIYADGAPGSLAPGRLLTSITQTFAIPYRPSSSPRCEGGRWMDMSTRDAHPCYSGYATTIKFDLNGIVLPATSSGHCLQHDALRSGSDR